MFLLAKHFTNLAHAQHDDFLLLHPCPRGGEFAITRHARDLRPFLSAPAHTQGTGQPMVSSPKVLHLASQH